MKGSFARSASHTTCPELETAIALQLVRSEASLASEENLSSKLTLVVVLVAELLLLLFWLNASLDALVAASRSSLFSLKYESMLMSWPSAQVSAQEEV